MASWTAAFANALANVSTTTVRAATTTAATAAATNTTTAATAATTTAAYATTIPFVSASPAYNFTERVGVVTLAFASLSSVLSILGCVGILCVFINFSALRSTSKKLLMYLTIADFFTAAGNLAGITRYILYKYEDYDHHMYDDDICSPPGYVCKVQSFITTSSSLMSFFWMMVISSYFHISIIKGNTTSVAEKLMWLCHIFCWGVPLVIVSSAAGLDILGEDKSYGAGSWCWLTLCLDNYKHNLNPTWWMLISGKLFEMITYLMLVINYASVKLILVARRRARILRDVYNSCHTPENWAGDQNSQNSDESAEVGAPVEHLHPGDVMFIYAPIIMLVLRIWGTIKFLLLSIMGPVDIEQNFMEVERALTFLQGVGDSGQGFMNFVLFCILTAEVRQQIAAWYHRFTTTTNSDNSSLQRNIDANTASREKRARRLVGTYNDRLVKGNSGRTSSTDSSNQEESDEVTPLLRNDHSNTRQIQTEPPTASKGKRLFKTRQFDYTVA